MAAAGVVLANKRMQQSGGRLSVTRDVIARNLLPSLLLLVLLSRLCFAFMILKANGPAGFLASDSPTYIHPAQNLLHGSFSQKFPGDPEIFRTPAYPLLLVPAVLSGHLLAFGVLENILLSVACAWLIWKIAVHLMPGTRAAFWAVLLYCLEPMSWLFAEKILSETLFVTLFLIFLWFMICFLEEPGYKKLLCSVFALGCATYARPTTLYFGIWLMPFLLWFPRMQSWRQRAMRAIVFSLAFCLTLLPWIVRNAVVADYHSFTSSGAHNLYFYSAMSVRAKLEHRTLDELYQSESNGENGRYLQTHPEQRTWTHAQRLRFLEAEGRKTVLEHLLLYARIHAKGCLIVLFEPGATEILKILHLYPEAGGLLSRTLNEGFISATWWLVRQYPATAILIPLLMLQLLLYYAVGIVGLLRLPMAIQCLFVVTIIYLVLVSGFPAAMSRFRVPIMPIVCICAGIGIANRAKKLPA